jgi:ATP-dependent exoDNAse (exonuclease V) beta subunit
MIQVMKASAGSGKTFNLAKKYIGIVLTSEDRYAYRGVLAVTFTNKATAEMKSRILKELRILATEPEKSDYLEDFVPSLFASAGALQKKAESVLVDILHDYGAFSISTIDKFFQQTL